MKKLNLADLKQGAIFYECSYGDNIHCELLEDPQLIGRSIRAKVNREGRKELIFQQAGEYKTCLPVLYESPFYGER